LSEPEEIDRHTLFVLQRAVKRKARKARFPAFHDGELVVYCMRCLKSNHEVERILYEPFFSVCSECVENLGIFLEHLRNAEKHRHTQTQSEPDEGQSEMGGEPEVA
jgi:hypothetical protein